MPIVIARSGEILQAPVLTQEQKDRAWEAIIDGWGEAHPDQLRELVLDQAQAAAGN